MNIFTPKKLQPEDNLGEKLQQTRLFKGLRIEEAAKQTNIRTEYLSALESERFDDLPAGLYGKKFLAQYLDFLGLNPEEFEKYWDNPNSQASEENPFSQKIVKKNKFLVFPKIFRNILIGLAILICFLYLILYFKKIIFAPYLIITNPETNLATNASSLTISGQTEKEAEVRINGELILNNQNGFFSQTINLKKGLNNLVIKAKKKYSQEKTITRQILVE